jgi:hypothetical protein
VTHSVLAILFVLSCAWIAVSADLHAPARYGLVAMVLATAIVFVELVFGLRS